MDWHWLLWGLGWALLLAAAILAGLWSYRVATTGDTSFSFAWLFPPRPEPRLAIMEQASVDRMRRLVLIRRDDVEHLIMTGGPVDVVIETNIGRRTRGGGDVVEAPQAVFSRPQRTFGSSAANE